MPKIIIPTLKLEKKLWKKGFKVVCGLDEVGRGCFAGPVVVGAVAFSPGCILPDGILDSKLLKPRMRERLDKAIKSCALATSIAEIGVSKIDKLGMAKATQAAFRKAVNSLPKRADHILIDAFYIKHLNKKRQQAIKNGDEIVTSIAAASIIAKVYRDKVMKKLHKKYPQYGFGKHKGYGTKAHQVAIKSHGLSKLHRQSFNLQKYL